ncbi:hypothetical protein [Ruegeria jejuensis]|uniref:hypothetical protein n=1 Tax=Ruegeria jejuensis TaxID=3233338 RepID=UPI00355B664A
MSIAIKSATYAKPSLSLAIGKGKHELSKKHSTKRRMTEITKRLSPATGFVAQMGKGFTV